MGEFHSAFLALAALASPAVQGPPDLEPSRLVSTLGSSPYLHPISHRGGGDVRLIRSSIDYEYPLGLRRYSGVRFEPSRQSYEYFLTSLASEQEGNDFFECETDGSPPREIAVLEVRPRIEDANFIRVYERDSRSLIRMVRIPQHWTIRDCADIDADGLDDFLLQDEYPRDSNFLGLRGFDGARIGQVEILGASGPYRVVLGQFDSDLPLEIFSVHWDQSGRTCAIADLETGRFVKHFIGHWENLQVADVDFDGRDEIVVGRYENFHFSRYYFVECWDVARWWRRWSVSTGDIRLMDVCDLDGNGTIEVIASPRNGRDMDILHGGSGLTAGSIPSTPSRGTAYSMFVADADKDGRWELIWEMEDPSSYLMITDAVTGEKEWEERGYYGRWMSLDVGDLNHDGRDDLLALDGHSDGGNSMALIDARTFHDPSSSEMRDATDIGPSAAVDVDGDGQDEALTVARVPYSSHPTHAMLYRWSGTDMRSEWSVGDDSWDAFKGAFADTLEFDQDARKELVLGMNTVDNPHREIHLLAIVDFPSGARLRQWPVNLIGARVFDHDEDGDEEILELDRQDLVIRDPQSGAIVDRHAFGAASSLEVGRRNGHGVVLVGTQYGAVHFLEASPQGLNPVLRVQPAGTPILAAAPDEAHGLLYSVSDGVARVHDSTSGALLHSSKQYQFNFGRDLRVLVGARPAFAVTDDYTLYRFDVP